MDIPVPDFIDTGTAPGQVQHWMNEIGEGVAMTL